MGTPNTELLRKALLVWDKYLDEKDTSDFSFIQVADYINDYVSDCEAKHGREAGVSHLRIDGDKETQGRTAWRLSKIARQLIENVGKGKFPQYNPGGIVR